ncbi:MAG: hypothetical protein ABIH46_02660 [Chloroflexota bacterium]
MDFDISWKEPTEAQLAAFELACDALGVTRADREYMRGHHHMMVMLESTRRAMAVDAEIYSGPAHAMTPYTLAEMVLLADGSLWYTQAKGWAEGNVPKSLEQFKPVFMMAGIATKRIVEWGYQDGKWWDVKSIWPESQWPGMALQLSAILEAVRLVDAINTPRDAKDLVMRVLNDDTGYLLSPGWRWFPKCIMPGLDLKLLTKMMGGGNQDVVKTVVGEIRAYFEPDFRKVWNKAKGKARAQISKEYEPTKCIKPECENLIAPKGIEPREGHFKNYRGLGSCCRGHASYYCTKCKAPHSHSSKTGRSHYPKFYGKDWDGTDAEGNEWKPK